MGLPGSIQGHLGKKQAAPEQQSAAPQVLFTSHVTMSQGGGAASQPGSQMGAKMKPPKYTSLSTKLHTAGWASRGQSSAGLPRPAMQSYTSKVTLHGTFQCSPAPSHNQVCFIGTSVWKLFDISLYDTQCHT